MPFSHAALMSGNSNSSRSSSKVLSLGMHLLAPILWIHIATTRKQQPGYAIKARRGVIGRNQLDGLMPSSHVNGRHIIPHGQLLVSAGYEDA